MPDGASWLGTQDHSKWAISAPGAADPPVVCVGDLNRMCSQEKRGGGTVCLYDSASGAPVWTSFNAAVASTEACWENNPCGGSSTQCYWCPGDSDTSAPSPATTSAPTLPADQVALANGDVALVGFDADNPDAFSTVFLVEVTAGTQVLFTDKAWTGTELRSGEGVLAMTAVQTLPAGTVVLFGDDQQPSDAVQWSSVEVSFAHVPSFCAGTYCSNVY